MGFPLEAEDFVSEYRKSYNMEWGSGPPRPAYGKAQSCRYPQEYWLETFGKSTKLSMLGHHRTASEAPFLKMAFCWRADGGTFFLLGIVFLRSTATDPFPI